MARPKEIRNILTEKELQSMKQMVAYIITQNLSYGGRDARKHHSYSTPECSLYSHYKPWCVIHALRILFIEICGKTFICLFEYSMRIFIQEVIRNS